MGKEDLDQLFAKIVEVESGSGMGSEKLAAFREMFDFVLDPPNPTSSSRRGDEAAGPSHSSQPVEVETPKALKAFRTVFRRHFRRDPYINWEVAYEEAVTEFYTASNIPPTIRRRHPEHPLSSIMDEGEQMELEVKWIEEVNNWRRGNLLKSAKEDLLTKFRNNVWHYEFAAVVSSEPVKLSEEHSNPKELITEIVNEFRREFPVFEKEGQLQQWCNEFREELELLQAQVLEEAKQYECSWEHRSNIRLDKYRDEMRIYFDEQPFLKTEDVNHFHEIAKAGAEMTLFRFLSDPVKKTEWEARVDEQFRRLEEKWRADGDAKIRDYQQAIQAENQRICREKFKMELSNAELEEMVSHDIPKVLRRKLEKVIVGGAVLSTSEGEVSGGAISGPEGRDDQGPRKDVSRNPTKKYTLANIWAKYGGKDRIIIPAHTPFPTTLHQTWETTLDGQRLALLYIYQEGYSEAVPFRDLGQVAWKSIPPGKKGLEKLELTMTVTDSGALHATTKVKSTGGELAGLLERSVLCLVKVPSKSERKSRQRQGDEDRSAATGTSKRCQAADYQGTAVSGSSGTQKKRKVRDAGVSNTSSLFFVSSRDVQTLYDHE